MQKDTVHNDSASGTFTQNTSYARVVKAYPSRKQAILLPYKDDLPLIDYVVAIGRFIGPKIILSASKILKKRICIYLSSETVVNKLLENHKII